MNLLILQCCALKKNFLNMYKLFDFLFYLFWSKVNLVSNFVGHKNKLHTHKLNVYYIELE